jgi:hypothetical protein
VPGAPSSLLTCRGDVCGRRCMSRLVCDMPLASRLLGCCCLLLLWLLLLRRRRRRACCQPLLYDLLCHLVAPLWQLIICHLQV